MSGERIRLRWHEGVYYRLRYRITRIRRKLGHWLAPQLCPNCRGPMNRPGGPPGYPYWDLDVETCWRCDQEQYPDG